MHDKKTLHICDSYFIVWLGLGDQLTTTSVFDMINAIYRLSRQAFDFIGMGKRWGTILLLPVQLKSAGIAE